MCVSHSCVCHDSFMCVLWFIHVYAITHSYVCHDSCMYCVCVCMLIYIHKRIYIYTYACIYTCIYIYINMYIYVYKYMYVALWGRCPQSWRVLQCVAVCSSVSWNVCSSMGKVPPKLAVCWGVLRCVAVCRSMYVGLWGRCPQSWHCVAVCCVV